MRSLQVVRGCGLGCGRRQLSVGRYPGRLDLDVLRLSKWGVSLRASLLRDQVVARGEGASGRVERVADPAAVTVELLLNPASAAVERNSGNTDDVEQVHDRNRCRISSATAVSSPENPSIATTSTFLRQALGRAASRSLNTASDRPSTMPSGRAVLARSWSWMSPVFPPSVSALGPGDTRRSAP